MKALVMIDAIRAGQLAAQPEQEPVAPDDESICDDWISASDSDGIAYDGPSFECGYKIGRIAERDAQPEQKQMAYCTYPKCQSAAGCTGACTTPAAQRPWVGLTDEDKKKIATAAGCTEDDDGHIVSEIFRLSEAKLKEKNT
jgi:hypothetical protein